MTPEAAEEFVRLLDVTDEETEEAPDPNLSFQVSFAPEICARLKIIARERGVSVEELIRFAVNEEVQYDFLTAGARAERGEYPTAEPLVNEHPLLGASKKRGCEETKVRNAG